MVGDYSEIEKFLVGVLGFSEKEAALCSMRRYRLLREGYEVRNEEAWRVARWRAWMDIGLTPNIKNRPRRPEDVLKLPSDREVWVEKVEITDDIVIALKSIGVIGGNC